MFCLGSGLKLGATEGSRSENKSKTNIHTYKVGLPGHTPSNFVNTYAHFSGRHKK